MPTAAGHYTLMNCACCRLFERASVDASTLQALLTHLLTVASDLSQPDSSCPAAYSVIQELALHTGSRYLQVSDKSKSAGSVTPHCQLVRILKEHPQQAPWAVSLLQVLAEEISPVLLTVIDMSKASTVARHCCAA